MKTQRVPLKKIVAGKNDRTVFNEAKLATLAESMATVGLQQPIVVRPVGDHFELVAGERRVKAASILGWTEIEAWVKPLADEEAAAIMLLENVGREQLNPIDEGRAYEVRAKRFGWPLKRVAQVAGTSADVVRRRVALMRLTPEIQQLVATGHMPLGHAEAMSDLDPNRQRLAVGIMVDGRAVTLAVFRRFVGELKAEQDQDAMFDLSALWVQAVDENVIHPNGVLAVVDVPTANDLPEVNVKGAVGAGDVIVAYIETLVDHGFQREAAAIGKVYRALVRRRFASLPRSRPQAVPKAPHKAGR